MGSQEPVLTRQGRRKERARRRHRRVVAALVAVAAITVGAAVGFGALSSSDHRRANGPSHAAGAKTGNSASQATDAPQLTATSLGPFGVESAAIAAENQRPGTTAWQISADAAAHGTIDGFTDRNYVADGESFGLYVSTTAAKFHVVAYRMGWYGGAGGRQVWASGELPGVAQPKCPVIKSTNTVECDNWSKALTVDVDQAWPPGDYLLKLVGSDNEQAYVPMTVWQPASHAAYLVVNRSTTEQGWDTYGGYDFYQGLGPCLLDTSSYPPCNRARVVSLDRPYVAGHGSSDFLDNEYPLIRWMEKHGLDATYATNITLDEHPAFAAQHRAWLSLDHDETWTYHELQAAKSAAAAGTNVVFFSGAAIVRHARLQASPLGPDREIVDYRNNSEDPAASKGDPNQVTGNSWDEGQTAFTGEMYSGLVPPDKPPVPMVITDASSWLFQGTGLANGANIPAAVGSDIDHINPSVAVPADLQVLAHSPIPPGEGYTSSRTWNGYNYSDFTYYTEPGSKAGIIDTGDTTFITELLPCPPGTASCPAPVLTTMVANIMRLVGQGPAGAVQPSAPNWKSIVPYGS
ncbi:hypothetical protein K6U06_19620 [Acidiferrimicrobium sp. IK]|uniref:N,N-dimethylformamidase beta subunit family domain-containing protein n=1 Tax=Acidiferrimicrobium sp. IK TaxID=2871700 RepID=UPI0021CB4405|nr:N,N-dimethylformamidase beta subunit family domain-containing protein [Acidiferrimicrobium sp. IK]MCU4186583.1 hypothetical protein [Acidiferrimicrobium sp. IK]